MISPRNKAFHHISSSEELSGRKLEKNENMKHFFNRSITFIAILLASTQLSGQTVKVSVEPNHSTVGFVVKIAGGVTRVTGKFTDFALDMDYVDKDITKSSVLFTIEAASINTGIDQRDAHLRTADFFDVEKFPQITFKSSAIRKKGEAYEMDGTFTMHGVSKEVTIPFELTSTTGYPSASIRWSLNREDYGIFFEHTTEKNFLSKQIGIEIDFWTRKSKKQ